MHETDELTTILTQHHMYMLYETDPDKCDMSLIAPAVYVCMWLYETGPDE